MTEELKKDFTKLRFFDENGEEYSEWEDTKLGDLIEKGGSGGTPTSTNKKYYGGEYPFLSIADITKQGKFLESTEKSLTNAGIKNSSAWVVPSGSLIYAMYASVGKMCINKEKITTSQALYAMNFKGEALLDYIYYALVQFNKKKINKYITTGTQSNINAKSLNSFGIPLPSLEEQEKIASFLSKLDERIELEEELLESTRNEKQAYMQRLLA